MKIALQHYLRNKEDVKREYLQRFSRGTIDPELQTLLDEACMESDCSQHGDHGHNHNHKHEHDHSSSDGSE